MGYRTSHLDRGSDYDQAVRESPFDDYMSRWEAVHVHEMVARRFPQGAARYLDFACGTARITSIVSRLAHETIGVDVSPSMLASAARKLPTVRFVQGDLTADDLKLGQFDLVTAFRFFGNAEQELREQVLAALRRHVAPTGYLLLNNHRNPRSIASLLARATGQRTEMDLTHAKLSALLGRHGFEIVERRPIGVWMYRASVQNRAGRPLAQEQRLERIFRSDWLVPVAPDSLILARPTAGSS